MHNTCHLDYTWKKVERGIRYREHPTRRHGVQYAARIHDAMRSTASASCPMKP